MTEQTIVVEGLPEGWKAVAFRIASNENIIDCGEVLFVTGTTKFPCLVVEKIQPRRIVLDETSEVRKVKRNEYYFDRKGNLAFWSSNGESIEKYNIVREVKETDIPLNNYEPKLSLSVNECKEAMRKLETFNVTDLSVKICRFLKDK